MQNTAEKLEFNRIKEDLLRFVKTERGRDSVLSLGEFLSFDDLVKEKELLQEMIYIRERFSALPLDASSNLEDSISFASKGGVLNESTLENFAHDVLINQAIKKYFNQVEDNNPLKVLALDTLDLSFIEREIHQAIAPDLTIFDDASLTLKSIRLAKKRLEKEISKKTNSLVDSFKEYLTSSVLTIRDGHYCLPVSTSYKNKVRGIIMDISHSGGTTFIEPEVLLSLNNKMKELLLNEKEEIYKILESLSSLIASNASSLRKINETIGRLDFLEAKAKYADSIKGSIAILEKKPCVILKEARHPLIDPNKVVPNNFNLLENAPLYVISGPNAGGKTIALKTVGLLVYMNEVGLPIPALEGSKLGYFKHIYVDIGDSQSISDSLSTFSGHMANLASLLKQVGGNDLVLLDEVGTGTSPKEGESLAYAILMSLKKKHAFALVSSHFEGLKAAALDEKGILNASMRFDEETLEPTYRLIEGIPGDSYGLIVARRFGMDDELIKLAESKLNEGTDITISMALRKLNDSAILLEKERDEIKKEREAILLKEEELNKNNEKLEKRLKGLSKEIEELKEKELKEFKDKADAILSSLNKDTPIFKGDITKAKNELDKLIEVKEDITFNEELKENDYVLLPSLNIDGRIKVINGNNVTLVTKDGLTFKTKKDKLTKINEPKKKVTPISGLKVDQEAFKTTLPLELNLIGLRKEEALLKLEIYLDKCRIKKYKRVRIIHGFGSGTLRKMVQDYSLLHKEFIDHIEMASESEGAGGATIVYLK